MVMDDGDRAFFRAEIERLTDRLYGTALRLTRNSANAEDLVSEAVTKAWANLGQLQDRQAFEKWLFRILTNCFISGRRAAREQLMEKPDDAEELFSLFEQLHQPFLLWWSNPEREFLNKLLREDIERALDALPEGFRAVVIMIEVEGYAYAEAADLLGVPVGTVRSRLSRARSLLQRTLWDQAQAAGVIAAKRNEEHVHE
jgi:RNA polymerase sigma-70 factor (ECF subfamily)